MIDPLPPGELNPKVPVELEGIIGKAMEKDRKERYQSATQMKADLQQLKRETESGQLKSGFHAGESTVTLAELCGPGVARLDDCPSRTLARLILRCYWDDEPKPFGRGALGLFLQRLG